MQANRTWNVAQRATKPAPVPVPVPSLDALRTLDARRELAEIRDHRRHFADMAENPSLPAEVRALAARMAQAADRVIERLP